LVLGFFGNGVFFGNGIWLDLAWLGFWLKKGGDVLFFFWVYCTIFVWRSVRGVVGDRLVGGEDLGCVIRGFLNGMG
jgi:hypothetical protein